MSEFAELFDYRRRVAEIYARVRGGPVDVSTWRSWVGDRDELFATHPQTALEEPFGFTGLRYFDHDPTWRTTGELDTVSPQPWGDFIRIGTIRFELHEQAHELPMFWLDSYGGGMFVPFTDRTNGDTTYGGGRYLIDSAKGADLGSHGGTIVMDFNYAYHPSCVHSARWVCPLAPLDSRLEVAVTAGERLAKSS